MNIRPGSLRFRDFFIPERLRSKTARMLPLSPFPRERQTGRPVIMRMTASGNACFRSLRNREKKHSATSGECRKGVPHCCDEAFRRMALNRQAFSLSSRISQRFVSSRVFSCRNISIHDEDGRRLFPVPSPSNPGFPSLKRLVTIVICRRYSLYGQLRLYAAGDFSLSERSFFRCFTISLQYCVVYSGKNERTLSRR